MRSKASGSGVPCAVLLDGLRSGGDGLGRIPGDEPECRMVAAVEVTAGDLQVATVEVAVTRNVTLCICYRECTSGGVRHRGGGITATIRSGVNHPVGRVAAGGGNRYACIIRLRERKAVHPHRFCGDVAGRQGVVALAFRSNMILYPLRGSQVSFINC